MSNSQYKSYNELEAAMNFSNAIEKADNALRNGWISSERHVALIKRAHHNKALTESGHWDYEAWKQGA